MKLEASKFKGKRKKAIKSHNLYDLKKPRNLIYFNRTIELSEGSGWKKGKFNLNRNLCETFCGLLTGRKKGNWIFAYFCLRRDMTGVGWICGEANFPMIPFFRFS